MDVPFLDLKTPHRELWPEIAPDFEKAFADAAFIGGPQLQKFEEEFAAFADVPYCVAVNSGTDALRLALIALGIREGDEVITVPHTFIATTEAISQAGGEPVFVDIEDKTYTLDPAKVEAAITASTKAIVPVHLYGQCADMGPLLDIAKSRGLILLEDAAQAHGATWQGKPAGSMGNAAGFSYYPGKNLGACGEGGAVSTSDAAVADRVRMLRDHGQSRKYVHEVEGYNARMDALQAIALRAKLRKLAGWNANRKRAAAQYDKRLAGTRGIQTPTVATGREHVYHLYVVLIENRERVQAYLEERGVHTGLHYPIPLHVQKAYENLGYKKGDFPVSERVASMCLSLPMFPTLKPEQIDYVCDTLIEAVAKA